MNHHMNKSTRTWLVVLAIITTLIVVTILAAFWATSRFGVPPPPFQRRFPPQYQIPEDIELYYTVGTIVSTINVTLLILLLVIYVDIYRRTRSEFTTGLIIMSMAFLLTALASNPFVRQVFGFRPYGLGPFAMLPDLFTTVALAVLLYLSIKY
jgi:hypothetical protein